jgi:two-component system alkaline phosphatase synthesis response regulator PhoP
VTKTGEQFRSGGHDLSRVFIIANEREQAEQIKTELALRGLECVILPAKGGAIEQIAGQLHGVSLLDMDEVTIGSEGWELAQKMRQDMNIPLIVLMSRGKLNGLDSNSSVDDFVVKPWEATEMITRMKRILIQKGDIGSEDVIRCGDLVIDSGKCEVLLGSKSIVLTFKEYQLLKFLAANKGKAFTREALLNKVWGWNYYGGDRTVDVHIRRLRTKLEDPTHTFIDTVRNIGYKLRENP